MKEKIKEKDKILKLKQKIEYYKTFKDEKEQFEKKIKELEKEYGVQHGKLLVTEAKRDQWFRERNILFDKVDQLKSQLKEQAKQIFEDIENLKGLGGLTVRDREIDRLKKKWLK